MHILFISEFFPSLTKPIFSGGVEARSYYIATNLAKKHTVIVLARKKSGELALEQNGNITIKRFGSEISDTKASITSLFSRLCYVFWVVWQGFDLKQIDIIEAANFVTYIPASLLGIIKKVPTLAFYPDVLLGVWQKQFGFFLGLIGEISERISLLLPWTRFIVTDVSVLKKLEKAGIVKNKIALIPCGVDISKIRPYCQVKKDKKLLLVVSRLTAYKRVDWAIKLMSKISDQQVKLGIIGSGPQENTLKQMVKRMKLTNRVWFKKNLDQKTLYTTMAKAQLLIHPSLIEGFGIVLVEAAALGAPALVADIPTSQTFVKTLGSVELFEKDNFADFISKAQSLLKNQEKIRQLRDNGLKKVAVYNWEKIANETENLYQLCLKK
ncbi:glycosyltransferase family 4 protein [Candidatus Beckwithbacteria bacterium]|nr:glycosyltransferase family 4 protein [Candidatus Beckwithbacteria bacterium]